MINYAIFLDHVIYGQSLVLSKLSKFLSLARSELTFDFFDFVSK